MKIRFKTFRNLIIYSLLLTGLFLLASCNLNWNPEHPQITRGKTLYNNYCIECHGNNGKGVKGLIGQYDKLDLTTIQERRDADEFPIMEIARYIDGREHYKDFGARPMPMWGVDLMTLESEYNPDTARSNLGALISYLITLQETE